MRNLKYCFHLTAAESRVLEYFHISLVITDSAMSELEWRRLGAGKNTTNAWCVCVSQHVRDQNVNGHLYMPKHYPSTVTMHHSVAKKHNLVLWIQRTARKVFECLHFDAVPEKSHTPASVLADVDENTGAWQAAHSHGMRRIHWRSVSGFQETSMGSGFLYFHIRN